MEQTVCHKTHWSHYSLRSKVHALRFSDRARNGAQLDAETIPVELGLAKPRSGKSAHDLVLRSCCPNSSSCAVGGSVHTLLCATWRTTFRRCCSSADILDSKQRPHTMDGIQNQRPCKGSRCLEDDPVWWTPCSFPGTLLNGHEAHPGATL